MELGKGNLLKSGVNTLSQSIHLKHGLAWTDGKQINLTQVKHLAKGISENEKQLKLGSFDYVESVCWSNFKSTSCYLCVVHEDTVSIWIIEGSHSAITSKQIRKISVSPLPQGCLWNPCSDILCILTKEQCNFYYNHQNAKSSFAVALPSIVEGGKISCGSWSGDGSKLYVAVGRSIVEYVWTDIKNISNYTGAVWTVPDLEGDLCCVATLSNGVFAFAAETPLDALLDDDMFETPEVDVESDEEDKEEDRDNNNIPHVTADLPKVTEIEDDGGAEDDDIIRPKFEPDTSITQKLFNLDIKDNQKETQMSQLIIVSTEPYLRKLSSVSIPEILVPDLIHYHVASGTLLVGANSQTKIFMHDCRVPENVIGTGVIELGQNERPKGLGTFQWPSKSLSQIGVMIGQSEVDDSAFLTSTAFKEYNLELQVYSASQADSDILSKGSRPKAYSSPAMVLNDASPIDSVKKKHKEKKESPKIKDLKVMKSTKSPKSPKPDTKESGHFDKLFKPFFRSGSKGPKIIDISKNAESVDVEVETVNFSDQPAMFIQNPRIEISQERLDVRTVDSDKRHSFVSDGEAKERVDRDEETISLDSPRNSINLSSKSNSLPNMIDQIHKNIERLESGEAAKANKKSIKKKKKKSREDKKLSKDSGDLRLIKEEDETPKFVQKTEATDDSSSEEEISKEDTRSVSTISKTAEINSDDEEKFQLEIASIEQDMKQQAVLLEQLDDKMDSICRSINKISVVQPAGYPTIDQIEMVEIIHVSEFEDTTTKKSFLLDNGRIKFDAVKSAFDLVNLEIIIDDVPIVVSDNVDGYIPIRFDADSIIYITGRRQKRETTEL